MYIYIYAYVNEILLYIVQLIFSTYHVLEIFPCLYIFS